MLKRERGTKQDKGHHTTNEEKEKRLQRDRNDKPTNRWNAFERKNINGRGSDEPWQVVDEISDLILSFRRCRSDRAYETQYFSQYPTLPRETLLNYDFVDAKKEKKKIYGLKCVGLFE